MLSQVIKRKQTEFKANNRGLYRLLLGVACLIAPVLLLLAPVPGAMLLADSTHSRLLGIGMLASLGIVSTCLYWYRWKGDELNYWRYVYGHRVWPRHLSAYIKHHPFYALVVVAGAWKAQPTPASFALYLLASALLFGLCFFLSAKLIRGLRQSQIWLSRGREIGLLLSLADRSWYLKQALQTGLLLLMTALLVATQNHKVFIIGGGICLAMNIYLGRSGYKRLTLCLQQHQGFFNYLGPALYTRLTRLNLSLNAIQPGLAGLLFVAGVSWN